MHWLRDFFRSPRGGRVGAWAAWILVGAWAAWALVRLAGLERGFPLVPLMAYTPYVAVGAVVPLAAAVGVRRARAALAALALVAIFAGLTLPRTFGGAESAGATSATLRVLTTNLEFGQGDPQTVVALARELDADVVAVQELTRQSAAGLRRAGLPRALPHAIRRPAASAAGGGIYSRLPLREVPRETLPGGFELPRARMNVDGTEVELASVHTVPPTDWGEESWEDDLEALPRASEAPLRVLAGDFNATLDHAALRDVLTSGYSDAGDALGKGFAPTWPNGRALPPPVTIDHVLYDERAAASEYSVHVVPGSDHRAVFAELALPPG